MSFPLEHRQHNMVFVGGSGSGKSELALNAARMMAATDRRPVHFFDLDMTKPLARSRDRKDLLASWGVTLHHQPQFMDAPTTVGGVAPLLENPEVLTVLDVGGDALGARSIGYLSAGLNQPHTAVYYVVNSYRAWSQSIEAIDHTLGSILGVSRLALDKLQFVGNPHLGPATTAQQVIHGAQQLEEILSPYATIEFYTAQQSLLPSLEGKLSAPVYPLVLTLSTP